MALAVQGVEAIVGYTFNDMDLVREAVSAAGAVIAAGTRRFPDGNKRLAILGDTVLQLALAEEWYDGDQPRVAFDRIRQRIGSNHNLDSIGRGCNLHAFVILAGGQTVVSPITMAATVEAILGAVYLDSGNIDSVKSVMHRLGLTTASLD
ncbi:MAG: hypothetical protein Q9168_007990 [Polycauliona sp. 1 TL-2023]